MNKKILKVIYKLRYSNITMSTVEIARFVKKQYALRESLADIGRMITAIFPKAKPQKFSPYQLRVLIRLYQNFYNKEKLLRYFNKKFDLNLTYQQLIDHMHCNKVKAKRYYTTRMISSDTEKEIIKDYQKGFSTTKLANKYGYKTPKSINDILKNNGISRRNTNRLSSENVPYADLSFKEIDTAEKGYLLGLMLTDGYLSPNFAGLQLVDEDCISFLSQKLKIPYYVIPARNERYLPMYRLTIHGKERLKDIQHWGVVPRKSLILEGPPIEQISDLILPMIIRGIIDGDGWIRKDGKEFFICSASNAFIDWCEKALSKLGFIKMNKRYKEDTGNHIGILRSARQENIQLLKNIIYKTPYGMMRKYNRLYAI